MAPARPFWKGYLKLSLVSCPIAPFPASSSSIASSTPTRVRTCPDIVHVEKGGLTYACEILGSVLEVGFYPIPLPKDSASSLSSSR
jgi:hypothetical protein